LVKTSATLREAGGRRGIVNTIVRSPIELCSPPSLSKQDPEEEQREGEIGSASREREDE
jgi:hypothetical protein